MLLVEVVADLIDRVCRGKVVYVHIGIGRHPFFFVLRVRRKRSSQTREKPWANDEELLATRMETSYSQYYSVVGSWH